MLHCAMLSILCASAQNINDPPVIRSIGQAMEILRKPEALLRWLSMGPSPDIHDRYIDQNTRMWMMERAVGLGLGKQAIREAVLTYARQYIRAGHPHNMELPTVKRQAIELGILQPTDLPEIKLPTVRNRAR